MARKSNEFGLLITLLASLGVNFIQTQSAAEQAYYELITINGSLEVGKMDMDIIIEMLKNNRALWVTATVAGGFSLLVSIINAFFLYRQNKKQHDFDKQLEKYKAGIDNKTYMCKTKFDAEFSMYRELSQAFTVLVKECSQLFPSYYKDAREDYEKYKPIHDKCVDVS